ncbi:proton-conducting transporter membrane subunit [Nitrosomonas sp.]|uniref:NADH-quinone oxidoreductase subunit 5 family protein n=1 Tax=Nitrosomonas sp. TaxID=42353 RepID=UPI00283C8951|nr:proton-conducting transporter membrane subunit [Nitrosomonas sp.]MCP5242631.1 NADH-quinone oxidoreductase subunit L [Burkholderiales bacterium]MDR4513367.1 hypothetical protein [Nitrosomonas sp.]
MSIVVLVPLLPLIGALIVVAGGSESLHKRAKLAVYFLGAAFIGSALTLWHVATEGPITIRFYDPESLASLVFPMGFYIDRLSAVMMTLISCVGMIVYTYSVGNMFQDYNARRYLSLMAFTVFVLLCMVSSANIMMLFIFWQLLSYLLYILAHNHSHGPTLAGSFRTYTLLRVGDVAFLTGIVLAYQLYGTLEFGALFERAAETSVLLTPLPGIEISGATAVTLFLLIGGLCKSANFPFHIWLPSSLFAPTPMHALLHAGIINAGGFLINRLAPLFGMSSTVLHLAFAIGLITVIVGGLMMLRQNDIKRKLGYSTIGQMGYMIMECGLGAYALAVFHLIAHGFFKGSVFLYCGNVIHEARKHPSMPHGSHADKPREFSFLTWFTGLFTTLLIPLIILLAIHDVLDMPLLESQGLMIFLFFIWITSTQAILSLTRVQGVASWKVSASMISVWFFIIFIYLFLAETFTAFLYPDPEEVEFYLQAAALPDWLFSTIVAIVSLVIITTWSYMYISAKGGSIRVPGWVESFKLRLYTLSMNRFYIEKVYEGLGRVFSRVLNRIVGHDKGWSK